MNFRFQIWLSRYCKLIGYAFFMITGFSSTALLADPVPSGYVAYSIEDLKIGDRAGTSSGGSIGSQAKVYVGHDAYIQGSIYANGKIYLNDRSITTGSVVSGDQVIRGANISAGSISQYAQVERYTIPITTVSIGTSDITVPIEGTRILEPGNYKDITVLDRGQITLKKGIYNVNKFVLGNDVKFVLDYTKNSNVEVNAKTKMYFGDRVKMSFLNDTNSFALRFYAGGTDSCILGYDGVLYGNFTVPNAKLTLHDRTKFTGTLHAKKLELQPSIYGVIDAVFPTIQLITPVASSVIGTTHPRIVLHFSDNRAGLDWSMLQIKLNGLTVTSNFTIVNDSAIWQVPQNVSLPEGPNTITADIFDRAGNGTQIAKTFTVDGTAPVVAIQSPQNGFITNQSTIPVTWSIDGVSQNTQTSALLQDGLNTIIRSSTDQFGRTGSASVQGTLDQQAPVVVITSPANGAATNQTEIDVAWTVDGVAQTTEFAASLTEGENTITRSYTDAAGNTGTASIQVTLDTQIPVVAIMSPTNGTITNQSEIAFAWTVDGVAQTTELTVSLIEGENTITRSYTDAAGNTGTASIQVTLDTQIPVVAITSPANGMITNQSEIAVAWTVDGVAQTTELTASLTEGENIITRSRTDAAGNTGFASIRVVLTLIPNNAPKITSTPVVSVARKALYTYDVNAVDQDGDILKYSLKESPTGMEIDTKTGIITWNPEYVTKNDIDTGLGLQWIRVRDDLVASSRSYLTMFHAAYNSKEKKLLILQDTLPNNNDFPVGYLLTPDTIEPFTITGFNNRQNTMITYDAGSDCYVVYGGWYRSDAYLGDTWLFKNGEWIKMNVSGPGNRSNGMLFYNESTKRVNLFGGSYYQTKYSDTWEWDGQGWKKLAVSGPSSRMWASTAYIESEGKTILFGGSRGYQTQYVNDTWLWDGHSWKLAATTGPEPRENALMAYDRRTESVFLIGGFTRDSICFSSTWEWKNSEWKELNIQTPAVRRGLLWFDDESGKLFLYGRSLDDAFTSSDLWVLDYLPKYGGIPLTVQVEDEHSANDEQKYSIKVTGNNAPQIYSMPNVVCKPDSQYTYDVTANDFDGDPLDYFLISAPAGMTLDAETGRISWIPDSTQIGTHRVTLTVADVYGGIDAQQFRVTVNIPPVFTSTPVTEAMVGELYNYQVSVSDNEFVSVHFLDRPGEMSIDSNFLIFWTPQQNDAGISRVILQAVDKYGAVSEQSFYITVGINTPPQILSNPDTICDFFI